MIDIRTCSVINGASRLEPLSIRERDAHQAPATKPMLNVTEMAT